MFLMVDTLYKNLNIPLSHSMLQHDRQPLDRHGNRTAADELFKPPSLKKYDIIKKRNLFKIITKQVEKKEKKEDMLSAREIESLEKTDLNVTLWGTAKGWSSENYAVIESNQNGTQGLYRQGDEIGETGAVIKRVLRLSVVLHYNGKDQILEVSDKPLNKRRHNSKAGARKSATASNKTDKMEINIKRSLINDSMKDINNLMKQARVRPHFTAGKADGILLYGIKQSSMFKEMGIQNGDIIMGVDGTDIRSVEDAIGLYDTLKNSSEVKMQIKRRGKTKELLYHVE